MKRLFIAVILFTTVLGAASASPISGKGELNFAGAENFIRQFPEATSVNYKVTGQFTEVNFIWNGIQIQAYYDPEGNPLATARTIDRSSLPVNAQLNLQRNYPGGVVTSAIEYSDASDGLCYYVTVAVPNSTYLLHVSTSGEISVFKKMKH